MINDLLNIKPDKEQEITLWLVDEINTAERERTTLENRWVDWKKQYAAKPKQTRKNFPWPNASNVVYPLGAIHTDNLFARLFNSILRPNIGTVFSAQPLAKDWIHYCRPIEDFLDWSCDAELNLAYKCLDWLLEASKMGTGITKLLWERNPRKKVFHLSEGEESKSQFKTVVASKPSLYFCKLHDIFVPSDACDVQTSRWIDHRSNISPTELKAKKYNKSAGWKNIDRVIDWLEKPNKVDQQMDDDEGISQTQGKGVNIHEVWFRYDVDNDGLPENLVFHIHKEAAICLRAGINGYHHQDYPFHRIRFFPQEGRFYGIGICGMLEQMQEALTTSMNQLIDNATVANTRVWKGRRGSGIKPGERIFPSKMFMLEDPANDLRGEQLGDIYPSGPMILNLLKSISEQRTGVNDYYQGRESSVAGNRATATSTLALIRQSNLKTDLTLTDFGFGLAGLATQLLQLYQQYYPDGKAYMVLGDKGEYIEKLFNIPQEHIPEKIRIKLSASTVSENRDIEKQYMLQLIPLVNGYYQQLIQAMSAAVSPQAPPGAKDLIKRIVEGGSELMSRMVELFIKDPESIIPNMTELEAFLAAGPAPGQMPPGGPNAGPEGTVGTVTGTPGMEGLPPGA